MAESNSSEYGIGITTGAPFKIPSTLERAMEDGTRAYQDAKEWGWSDEAAREWRDIWAGSVFTEANRRTKKRAA